MNPDYSTITELPESDVLPIQVERSFSRYQFASEYSARKDVLEIACGGGQGLGLIAQNAKTVVGCDYDAINLTHAKQTYQGRKNISLLRVDAHNLPFPSASFDLILIYEAIYYLKNPDQFLEECKRVLRPQGTLIICTANKNWPDFNPSPFSHRYFSIPELSEILAKHGFNSNFYGAFPDYPHGTSGQIKSLIKKVAVKLHLMPRTMKGKVLLKKLFFGGLVKLPREFTPQSAPYTPPVVLNSKKIDTIHTALYAVANKI